MLGSTIPLLDLEVGVMALAKLISLGLRCQFLNLPLQAVCVLTLTILWPIIGLRNRKWSRVSVNQ